MIFVVCGREELFVLLNALKSPALKFENLDADCFEVFKKGPCSQ